MARAFDAGKWFILLAIAGLSVFGAEKLSDKAPGEFEPLVGGTSLLCALGYGVWYVLRSAPAKRGAAATEGGMLLGLCFIVTGIVYPVFQSARAASDTTSCISNVKRLAAAEIMYSGDFDDRFPPSGHWRTLSLPYMGEPEDVRCTKSNAPWTYAMNLKLSKAEEQALPEVLTTPLIFDSGGNDVNLAGGPEIFWTGHSKRGSVAFADGHAGMYNRRDVRWP